MDQWKMDFEWLRIRHLISDQLGLEKLPDLNAILVLIGIRELGTSETSFTKEEKQDLMHVAICTLLEDEYYEFEGMDADGWPHWKPLRQIEVKGVDDQEFLLKSKIIIYFDSLFSGQELEQKSM